MALTSLALSLETRQEAAAVLALLQSQVEQPRFHRKLDFDHRPFEGWVEGPRFEISLVRTFLTAGSLVVARGRVEAHAEGTRIEGRIALTTTSQIVLAAINATLAFVCTSVVVEDLKPRVSLADFEPWLIVLAGFVVSWIAFALEAHFTQAKLSEVLFAAARTKRA